ncbi:FAD-dependent monooxygenase [Martelella endophytica]|uniref:FAD-binding domain-containing protein n=1 Tax=Martelella endophytica TaxID=1486262 RepID=A0A0D5LMP5_MAREN|nr:FAD-dependent monooxygenase [Martelella endophytica]AJY45469.1 hypothetical protein TM49_06795 [Martelella endophytica]
MADPVVIVGGGPVGMTAAFFLGRAGIEVTVLEKLVEPYDDPRAATFHPPTLEMFSESGVTDQLLALGIPTPHWQFRDKQEGIIAEFDLALLDDITPYPFRMQCEQHKLVAVLEERLASMDNVTVLRGVEVSGLNEDAEGVTIATSAGDFHASWVIGTDGGRSVVRKSSGIGFEGFTFQERFLVITTSHDFETDGFAYSSYISDPEEWAAVFKVPGPDGKGRWRMTSATVPEADPEMLLSFENAQAKLQRFLPSADPYPVLHTNLYTVHQRVATRFRKGRVLLAGDASHVNNPLGGMGMNFGIHDAVNLSEKLVAVLDGADDSLMDLYDRQRRHVAEHFLQAMTIRNKKTLEEKDLGRRNAMLAEMRATAADRDKSRAHLMNTAMFASVRAAAAVE